MSSVLSTNYNNSHGEFAILPRLSRQRLGLFPTGNKCGHVPGVIRLVSSLNPFDLKDKWKEDDVDDLGSHRKSHFHYEFDRKIDQAYHYPAVFKSFSFHTDGRRKRSEGREAGLIILQVMIHYMCGANMKFGRTPRTREEIAEFGGFIYYDLKFLQSKTNITDSRIKRGLKWLVDNKYISRKRRYIKREDGTYKAVTSTTKINEKVFHDLGLIDKSKKLYQYAYAKAKKLARRLGVNIGTILNSKIFDVSELINKNAKPSNDDIPRDNLNYWRKKLPDSLRGALINNYTSIVEKNPEIDTEKALKMAFNQTKNI